MFRYAFEFCSVKAVYVGILVQILASGGWAGDWLLDPSPFRATAETNESRTQIRLTNGIIDRTFVLSPNVATIDLRNVQTGETVLRGIKPEARVVIDGRAFDVGGLVGQPNYAFLNPEWIPSLSSDVRAFQFEKYEVQEIKERFPWKQVRRHAPGVSWPPKGIELRFDYTMPAAEWNSDSSSEIGRELLHFDGFKKEENAWQIVRANSSKLEQAKIETNESTLKVSTIAGTAVFAERAIPEGTGLIETTINVGTDDDTSWGPGVGLVWDEKVIEVNLRPGDRGEHGHFELRNGGVEHLAKVNAFADEDGGISVKRSYRLRVRFQGNQLVWDVADATQPKLHFVKLFELIGSAKPPKFLRVGKTDRNGNATDNLPRLPKPESDLAEANQLRECMFSDLRFYGEWKQAKTEVNEPGESSPIRVSVHYELYDGLPCYGKWITVHNQSDSTIHVDSYQSDLLAAVEHTSEVDALSVGLTPPNLHVETEMAMGGMTSQGANRHSYRWVADPQYDSQVNYEKKTPCLLEIGPDLGPSQSIAAKSTWESYRSWVLLYDSTDRERSGLAVRKMFRTLAPWVTENPLMMHLVASDEASVIRAIDQCHEVGFEMLILSFGSGFNLESRDPAVLEKAKKWSSYANSKGIEIGSYSLLASRSIDAENDVVPREGEKPVFGNSPCLNSRWGKQYFDRLYEFHRLSGFDLLEHDGSYPGDPCASHLHPGHNGFEDSRWNQWKQIAEFYRWCRGEGLFLNVPDHYFLNGSNKTGMGYREVNWSLPREEQAIHTRQNIYDGTWQKTPSMGWMFVPLTEYHGGGPKATIEPLDQNIGHYRNMIRSNLALGVQACYRGPRLYDTDRVREMVKLEVSWFKEHRDILESDLIHGRRANARSLDWMLHVNPALEEKGLVAVFNPTNAVLRETIRVPLYYTGIRDSTIVIDSKGNQRQVNLESDNSVEIEVTIDPQSMEYFIFKTRVQ